MSTGALLLVIAAMAVLGFWLGKYRSLALVGGGRGIRRLHSLPSYYGLLAALWCALPCLLVLILWLAFQDRILVSLVTTGMGSAQPTDAAALGLLMNDMRNAVAGSVSMDTLEPHVQQARWRASARRCSWRALRWPCS
jgi:phosphate transport system permease protein